MFGGKRRKATSHVVESIRPLIAIYQHQYGLPASFWHDRFVLGFVGFLISFHTNITSGYSLSAEDKGYLLYDAFSALSLMNGKAIADEYVALASAEPKDAAFEQGADHAAACAYFSIGKVSDTSREWVRTAEKQASAFGATTDRNAVLGALIQLLFYTPLKERFGPGST